MSVKKRFLKSKSVCKVTFSLPKKAVNKAKTVKVVGDFNNWNKNKGVKMKATATAYTATVELEMGKDYQFRYLIDNKEWENDWKADAYAATPFGVENSVVSCMN